MVFIIITITRHYCHSHSFQTQCFMMLSFIPIIIISSISHNNRISLYVFFCLNPITNIVGDVLDISYCDNIKTWMNYCACWNYDSLLQWLLFPIPIGFSCMEQRYCALKTNSPAEITYPSIVVLFCSVYSSWE